MRRFVISLSLSLALFVYAGNVQAATSTGLLDDGGFNNSTHQSDVTGSAWVLTSNKPDGSDLATRFQHSGFSRSDGAVGADGGVWYRSFEGNQGGGGDPLAESTLTQDYIAGAGGDYTLDFDWAREVSFTAATWKVDLSVNSTVVDTIDLLTATSLGAGNFNQNLTGLGINTASLSAAGVVASDVVTVTATMLGGTDVGGSQSAFLDNFVLTTVPEPTSFVLLGMGSISVLLRRRR